MSRLIRLVAASALGLAALPASAGALTIGTLPPVTTQVVNNGPGNQTDPHVSGDLVSYTSEIGLFADTEIRYHDLTTGSDAAIPGTVDQDYLSDVSGSRIVFTHLTFEESAIYLYPTDGAASEVAPETSDSHRRAPAIGGQTVAFQDFSLTGNTIEPEIVVHDLGTGTITRLTNDSLLDHEVAVSPDGNVVVFTRCDTSGSSCDIVKAIRSGGAWTTNDVTSGAGEEATPDTNGAVIAYGSTRDGEQDIFYKTVAGVAEQRVALSSVDVNPNISGDLIAFERASSVGAPRDIYVYDSATDTLYQVTDTPGDESLSDISVSASGVIRVVNQVLESGNYNIYARSFALPSTLAAAVQQPVNPDGSSTFNVKRGVVPLKFTLTENGSATCQLPPATLRLTRTGGASPGPIDESLYTGSPDSGAQLRIADCRYHYNLSPGPLGPGAYLAEVLVNGAVVGAAHFELK